MLSLTEGKDTCQVFKNTLVQKLTELERNEKNEQSKRSSHPIERSL